MPMREIDPTDAGTTPEPKNRKLTLDEERRHAALNFALQGAVANTISSNVIQRAKDFEGYLKSGA